MSEICECKDVLVIRGDVLEITFNFTNIPQEAVSRVLFRTCCGRLEVECVYSEDSQGYVLRLESEVTDGLTPVISSYDLVVELADGNFLTVIHEGLFAVLKKKNWVEECQGDGEQ